MFAAGLSAKVLAARRAHDAQGVGTFFLQVEIRVCFSEIEGEVCPIIVGDTYERKRMGAFNS